MNHDRTSRPLPRTPKPPHPLRPAITTAPVSFPDRLPAPRLAARTPGIACLLAAGLLFSSVASGQFRPPPKASVAAVADLTSYAAGESVRVAAIVTIDDGWHIQSHTPSFEYLIPTELDFELPGGWSEPDVRYPAHIMWQSEFEADPLAVYEYETVIHADLELPDHLESGTVAVPLELTYQACDDRTCLPPTTAETTLQLAMGESGEATGHPAFETAAAPTSSGGGLSLLAALIPALLGGIIGIEEQPHVIGIYHGVVAEAGD